MTIEQRYPREFNSTRPQPPQIDIQTHRRKLKNHIIEAVEGSGVRAAQTVTEKVA